MTAIEAGQILFSHFLTKDHLNYNEILGLIPKDQNNDNGMAAMVAGLEELTNSGLLYKHQEGKENKTITWVLRAPLSLHNQNVQISGPVAFSISNVVSNFAESVETDEISSNPLNIKESDIMILLDIIQMYSEADIEEETNKENKTK